MEQVVVQELAVQVEQVVLQELAELQVQAV